MPEERLASFDSASCGQIALDQERDKVRAVVSMVMNLQFQLCTTQGISCVPEEKLASFDSASYGQLVRKVHICIR